MKKNLVQLAKTHCSRAKKTGFPSPLVSGRKRFRRLNKLICTQFKIGWTTMTFKILLIILYYFYFSISIHQVFSLNTNNNGVTCNNNCKEILNENEMIKAEYNKLKLVIRRFDLGKFEFRILDFGFRNSIFF